MKWKRLQFEGGSPAPVQLLTPEENTIEEYPQMNLLREQVDNKDGEIARLEGIVHTQKKIIVSEREKYGRLKNLIAGKDEQIDKKESEIRELTQKLTQKLEQQQEVNNALTRRLREEIQTSNVKTDRAYSLEYRLAQTKKKIKETAKILEGML